MTANNSFIANQFSLLSKLLELHGDNPFKVRAYSSAARLIDKLPQEISKLPPGKLASIKGIGDSVAKKIKEIFDYGEIKALTELVHKTPPGVLEMLKVKGIGAKKIAVIWKKMGIENVGELLYACNENRLTRYSGFGEKTQEAIQESIEYYLNNIGSYLYARVEDLAAALDQILKKQFKKYQFFQTGDIRRHLEVIDKLEWVTDAPAASLQSFLGKNNFAAEKLDAEQSIFRGKSDNTQLIFYHASSGQLYQKLFLTSASDEFLQAWNKKSRFKKSESYASEEEIFSSAKVKFIPAYLRETAEIIERARKNDLPVVIQPEDITGIIHCHSKWSDGLNTIEEMAEVAIEKGLQYLVISDHSKTAIYANGLSEERIQAQHEQIDELNKKLKPFRIFKSIESDILNDGSLDYPPDVLARFDLVIASIHSNVKMSEDKAMARLLNAVKNPFTSILGHCTGRLLLSRNGYPVRYNELIDACAKHNVAIELNANPRRLEIDWRHINYCLEKKVLISIDPDAHSTGAFDHTRYGVLAAQKAGVTKANNLSSFSLKEFEGFLKKQHAKRK